MAVAGARRLALWRDDAEHHGPRLERAFDRYARYADARPPGWATVPAAAFALFLAGAHAAAGRTVRSTGWPATSSDSTS